MPVIFHESKKKRLGNVGSDRRSRRVAPAPVWPGLDHNGKPIEVEEMPQHAAQVDDAPQDISSTVRTLRSRKRKKNFPAVWKEIVDPPDENLPEDLQGDGCTMTNTTQDYGNVAAGHTPTLQDTLSVTDANALPAIQVAGAAVENLCSSTTSQSHDVFKGLPDMVEGIAQIQSMLETLVSSHAQLSEKQDTQTQLLNQHESLLSRIEATAYRQETHQSQIVQRLQKRIQELEQEALHRDAVITELQKSQQQERKESQNRIMEALQKIEHLQTQNEKLHRLPSIQEQPKPRNVSYSTFLRTTNVQKHSQDMMCDSSESSDSFGIPVRRSDVDQPLSSESPFSTGSISSTQAVSRRKRIVPGHSLMRTNESRKTQTIRELIPNYALDSLARGRSRSSTSSRMG